MQVQSKSHLLHRFIFTFGAVGVIVFITASTALVGIAHNSRFFLGVYGFLVTAILVAQAVLAILIFTDNSWKKHIPDDPTGEQEKVASDTPASPTSLAVEISSSTCCLLSSAFAFTVVTDRSASLLRLQAANPDSKVDPPNCVG